MQALEQYSDLITLVISEVVEPNLIEEAIRCEQIRQRIA